MQSLRLYRLEPQTIRVATSATILGLTLSFALGEVTDSLASTLHRWEPIPRILPASFQPLEPARGLVRESVEGLWQDRWLALNSFGQAQNQEAILANLPQDEIRFIYSSSEIPARRAQAPSSFAPRTVAVVEAPQAHVATMGALWGARLGTREGEALVPPAQGTPVLMAEAPKVEPPQTPPRKAATGTVVVSNPEDPKQKPVVLSSNRKPVLSPAEETIESDPLPKTETVATKANPMGAVSATTTEWAIQGRISSAVSSVGHYEVGLFGKIDPEGNPVGFPIVQEILPEGQKNFRLRIPQRVKSGYLFAEFVGPRGRREWIAPPINPWRQSSREFVELVHSAPTRTTDSIASLSSAPQKKETLVIEGQARTAFTRPGTTIAQEGVVVKLRGRKESTRTDKDGRFRLELPAFTGRIPIEFLKAGFHPTVFEVNSSSLAPITVDLAARTAIDQLVFPIGLRQLSDRAVFLGQVAPSERGTAVQISAKAEGPYYFSDDGRLSPDLRSTSGDGRFLYFNVEPGPFFVETVSPKGETTAPFLVSTVEGGELIQRRMDFEVGAIRGRLFNPVAGGKSLAPIAGARIRVEGGTEWSSTDGFGSFQFGPIRWIKGERIALEASAPQFQLHRYLIDPNKNALRASENRGFSLFAFPAAYIQRLALSVDVEPDMGAGVVMGNVGPRAVRMDALADHSSVNATKDFYFSGRGQLLGSHTTTDPKFGTFALFNVPKGRVILNGNDTGGRLRFSDWILSSPGTVTVVNE